MIIDSTRLAPAKSRPSGAFRRSRKVYPDRAHSPVLAEILALGETQESGHPAAAGRTFATKFQAKRVDPAAAGCNHFIRF